MQPEGPAQAELFDVADVEGYSVLGRREQLFVAAIFAGCSQREAAKAAGYKGTEEVIDAAASRAIKNVKVQRLLNQAWHRSGARIDRVVRDAAEIMQRAMAEWRNGESAERRAAALKEWREAATLLASIHGKLQIKLSGTVNHLHEGEIGVAVPAEMLPELAQMRREFLQTGASQSTPTDLRQSFSGGGN